MEEEMARNGIMGEMEYLKELLHQEWERPGIPVAEVVFPIAEMKTVNQRIAAAIGKNMAQTNNMEFTFHQGMALSKECFLLLRLGKKIKEAEESVKKGQDEFAILLDKEEYGLFQCLFQTEGR